MLHFDHVTKLYGAVIGVNGITCDIGPGITGLLGANGAGKSTLLNLAAGQLRPSQGAVRIGRHHAWSSRAKREVGYSPDLHTLYEEMSGREFVYTMACLHGYARREARRRADDTLQRLGMAERADRRIAGYSHGMRQRVKLAQALVHDPPVLLLDEPLTGIDPLGRREVNDLLRGLAAEGKTIVFSSHLLDEVEQVADRIVVVARGRLMATGRLADVRRELADRPIVARVSGGSLRRLAALLAEWDEVSAVAIGRDWVDVTVTAPQPFFARLQQAVLEQAADVASLETLDEGADAVFRYLHQGAP